MRKSILLFLLASVLSSCSSENSNEVSLFNGLVFKMHQGESVEDIDSKIKNNYSDYFDDNRIDIPLYKYIKHNNYEIFLGLPYNTSSEAMIQSQLEKQDSSIIKFTVESDSSSFYKEYMKNNFYIAEYAIKTRNSSLIYICAISDSTVLPSELALSNRINIIDK